MHMYMHAWKRSTTSAPWLLYLRCLRYFGGRLTTPQVPNTLGTRTGRYRLTLRPFSSQEGPRLSRARAPLPVYAVFAISSLDTGSSLRQGTQTAWGFVGTPQGVAGLTPRPFTLEEETIMVMVMSIEDGAHPTPSWQVSG